jgi:diaminopimelate epimerase
MKIRFSKFHGTGNDFILIDNRGQQFTPERSLVGRLCDRHYGVGADGLILLTALEGYDFAMAYYNSDGNESTMCGNGGRCITAFGSRLGLFSGRATFTAIDGNHVGEVISASEAEYMVKVQLSDTRVEASTATGTFVHTGSPHLVRFVANAEEVDVVKEGRRIRYGKKFMDGGVNVDFVEVHKDILVVRTYERGVEDETLSCGTGVTAAALVAASKFEPSRGFYHVTAPGGRLKVSFTQKKNEFTDIWLEGPVAFVFEGEIEC